MWLLFLFETYVALLLAEVTEQGAVNDYGIGISVHPTKEIRDPERVVLYGWLK